MIREYQCIKIDTSGAGAGILWVNALILPHTGVDTLFKRVVGVIKIIASKRRVFRLLNHEILAVGHPVVIGLLGGCAFSNKLAH